MLPTSLQNCDICKTAFNNVPEYIRVEPIKISKEWNFLTARQHNQHTFTQDDTSGIPSRISFFWNLLTAQMKKDGFISVG